MTSKPNKRFIAGAVCPQCRALDRLVMTKFADGRQERACVACGFEDEVEVNAGAGVPRGRREKPNPTASDAPTTVVRIMDPDPSPPG